MPERTFIFYYDCFVQFLKFIISMILNILLEYVWEYDRKHLWYFYASKMLMYHEDKRTKMLLAKLLFYWCKNKVKAIHNKYIIV